MRKDTGTFITSRIDYWNSVFTRASSILIRVLQSVLHSAVRLIARRRKYGCITHTISDNLHRLLIPQRSEYKICTLVYKHNVTSWDGASILQGMRTCVNNPGWSQLCSAARGKLSVPRSKRETFGICCFSVAGLATWNTLPLTAWCWRLWTYLWPVYN